MFDFNTTETTSELKAIFNNGKAGRVANVQVELIKKSEEDKPNSPDFKIVFKDETGSCNIGWYHFTNNDQNTPEKNQTNAKNNILKLLAIAKALVPEGFVFPDSTGFNINQAEISLLKVIKEFAGTRPVNIFACYGYTAKPKAFLEPRAFNFIERVEVTEADTKLKQTNSDVMERVEATPQAATTQPSGFGGFGAPTNSFGAPAPAAPAAVDNFWGSK